MTINKFYRQKKYYFIVIILFFIIYLAYPPKKIFHDPLSLVIESREGEILGAHIADDGQWRFPETQKVTKKLAYSLILYEDKRFYYHPGIDPLAILRAFYLNIKAGKIISGGSTLTMQIVRISGKGKPRTYFQKTIEIIKAIKIELHFSKKELLSIYTSNAPYGGNVVGISAAAWRYFAKTQEELTWAEATMLAVLPNSPSLINPGKNRRNLIQKRNWLLKKLLDKEIITRETYALSLLETIPEKPNPFPNIAPHLLVRILNQSETNKKNKTIVKTTIKYKLQKNVNKVITRHHEHLKANDINNIAVLVINVENGEVLSYNGNVIFTKNKIQNNGYVDNITGQRSTGSILKPFLYAAMLSSGEILPTSIIPDIPTNIGGFIPKNYNRSYEGAIPAHKALARSLNIPAVRMLKDYGVPKFHNVLNELGITSIKKNPEHYGLSLILGGAEVNLWELCGVYASMARILKNYNEYSSQYEINAYTLPTYYPKVKKKDNKKLSNYSILSASAIYLTMQALLEVERPANESGWKYFEDTKQISWKTGTSFGFRDAWAIGITPDFVVGVWVGNSDGEGRPGLTGINTAAPILFDVFKLLPKSTAWFEMPYDDFIKLPVCPISGFQATQFCEQIDTIYAPINGERFEGCPYHHLIHLDKTGKYRVHGNCEKPSNMQHKSWFILPPTMELFYLRKNSSYKKLPEYRTDCKKNYLSQNRAMQIIYPNAKSKIFIPTELGGKKGKVVFEIAHSNTKATIYWHLDENYIGKTQHIHQFEIEANLGLHKITITDNNGEMLTFDFEIINE